MKENTAKNLLKKVVEDYDKISEEFDATRQKDWKEFSSFLPYIKNKSKLTDLGCGNGRFYDFIKEKRNLTYVGIDNNEKLLEKARTKFKNAKFTKGDLLKIPLNDEEIDTAIAIASIHHIPSQKLREKSIIEIHRILKEKGILIITAWNLFQPKYKKYIWKSRLKHILSFGKYDARDTFIPWGKTGVKRYYYAFTPTELRKLLEQKFEIIKETKGNNLIYICRKK